MKRYHLLKFITVLFTLCFFLSSCHSSEMSEYYSQKENYISLSGTVSYIKYNDDHTALYIGFSELSRAMDDTCFKIVGKNLEIVKSRQIDDKLCVGEEISFTTAPRYFGDGYVMPIVAISIEGSVFLHFEEGYGNLLDWLSK